MTVFKVAFLVENERLQAKVDFEHVIRFAEVFLEICKILPECAWWNRPGPGVFQIKKAPFRAKCKDSLRQTGQQPSNFYRQETQSHSFSRCLNRCWSNAEWQVWQLFRTFLSKEVGSMLGCWEVWKLNNNYVAVCLNL